jgi:hypothetical protein
MCQSESPVLEAIKSTYVVCEDIGNVLVNDVDILRQCGIQYYEEHIMVMATTVPL